MTNSVKCKCALLSQAKEPFFGKTWDALERHVGALANCFVTERLSRLSIPSPHREQTGFSRFATQWAYPDLSWCVEMKIFSEASRSAVPNLSLGVFPLVDSNWSPAEQDNQDCKSCTGFGNSVKQNKVIISLAAGKFNAKIELGSVFLDGLKLITCRQESLRLERLLQFSSMPETAKHA